MDSCCSWCGHSAIEHDPGCVRCHRRGDPCPGLMPHGARAILACLRTRHGDGRMVLAAWRDAAEAAEALAVLCEPSCEPKCEGNHLVLYGDGVTLRVLRGLRPFRSVVPDLFV
jgi:hypothetical protein